MTTVSNEFAGGLRPANLRQLRESGWVSRTVKREIHDNFIRELAAGRDLFPGLVGYEDTVVPALSLSILAEHDLLFLGEKGQGKSRLMRTLVRFLDPVVPFLAFPARRSMRIRSVR